MSHLTFEEVEYDRAASQRDLECLLKVTTGLSGFIENPCGEDRRFLLVDLLKWQAMFSEASRLHEKILKKHRELNPNKPPTP